MYFGDKQMLERIAQQADECDELDELLNGSDNVNIHCLAFSSCAECMVL